MTALCRIGHAVAVSAALSLVGGASGARASLPVPFAQIGCVVDGAFRTNDPGRAVLSHPALRALEGKTVRVEGTLSPGDRFHATGVFVVAPTCREELLGKQFLCSPCRTLPGKEERPFPRQPGEEVKVPAEALHELDDLGRRLRR